MSRNLYTMRHATKFKLGVRRSISAWLPSQYVCIGRYLCTYFLLQKREKNINFMLRARVYVDNMMVYLPI